MGKAKSTKDWYLPQLLLISIIVAIFVLYIFAKQSNNTDLDYIKSHQFPKNYIVSECSDVAVLKGVSQNSCRVHVKDSSVVRDVYVGRWVFTKGTELSLYENGGSLLYIDK